MAINKSAINETISDNIIHLRQQYGMSKKEVAETLGVKPNTYRVWESANGKNGVKNYYLLQLAKVYGVTVDYLMHPHGDTAEAAEAVVFNTTEKDAVYGDKSITDLSNHERISIMQMRRLSTADRQKVNDLVASLLDEMDRLNGITESDK